MRTTFNLHFLKHRPYKVQRGASLIMVMLILIVVSIVGVGAIQIAMMGERGARNDRDMQVAWQSAEAALVDAEYDIYISGTGAYEGSVTSLRQSIFTRGQTNLNAFVSGCGTSNNSIGLCTLAVSGKPAWLAVDFTETGNTNVHTTPFGLFTNRQSEFTYGSNGIQPVRPPRYVIEPIPDTLTGGVKDPAKANYLYRVTAMGFGPSAVSGRADVQAVVQMIFRN